MNHKCCEKKSSDIWYCEKKSLLFKSRRESYIVIMSEHKQMKIFFFSIGMRNKKIIFPMKHKCCEKKSVSSIQTNENIFF